MNTLLGKSYYKENLVYVTKTGKVLKLTSEDMHLCYMSYVGLQGNMLLHTRDTVVNSTF